MQLAGQPTDFTFHGLSVEDGLSASSQYRVTLDSRQLIWISTDNGLLRFDGHQVYAYRNSPDEPRGLPENELTSRCFEDAAGNLWFSTRGALVRYRYETDDFDIFKAPRQGGDYSLFHLDKKGQCWLQIKSGSHNGLWIFNPQRKSFTPGPAIPSGDCYAHTDNNGEVIGILSVAIAEDTGLRYLDLSDESTLSISFDRLEDGSPRRYFSPTSGCSITEDGAVWTGVYNGLGHFSLEDPEAFVVERRGDGVDRDFGFVRDIVEYDDRYLIVAADRGVLFFDKRQRKFVSQLRNGMERPHAFAVREPNTIYLDAQRTLWVGGGNGQLAFAKMGKAKFGVIPQMIGHSVVTLARDSQGRMWGATVENGVFILESDGQLKSHEREMDNVYYPNEPYPVPPINRFLSGADKGWWGNLENQFVRWDEARELFVFRENYLFEDTTMLLPKIRGRLQRANGETLVSFGNDIFLLDLREESIDTTAWYALDHLELSQIVFLGEDGSGNLFVGDETGRLVVLREGETGLVLLADEAVVGHCYALAPDPGRKRVWLATDKGLGQINTSDWAYSLLGGEADQLPQEPYCGLVMDAAGWLWLPGSNGLIRYAPDDNHFHRFGTADGLLSPVFSPYATQYDPSSNRIWLGGQNGLNVFCPDSIALSDFRPAIYFSNFLVNDLPDEKSRDPNRDPALKFAYRENTLSFEFVALDYGDPSANEFYYQLEGYDDVRVAAGDNNFVRYPNLPPGQYVFKVWATNADGIIHDVPRVVALRVIPPFTRTIWFYLLCVLFTSALIYGVFQYRLEQALKVERLRVKISSDLHDDVGGMLSGLAMQSELLEIDLPDDPGPALSRISDISRQAMSRMRDTVWAIDARKDRVENLLDRIREHAAETLDARGIGYVIQTNGLDPKVELATDVRQNLYLICKEAITNVAKHSNGDRVMIKLSNLPEDETFAMLIQDNGQVATKDYVTSGLGRSNMEMRARAIGAKLELFAGPEGFQVKLTRPSLKRRMGAGRLYSFWRRFYRPNSFSRPKV